MYIYGLDWDKMYIYKADINAVIPLSCVYTEIYAIGKWDSFMEMLGRISNMIMSIIKLQLRKNEHR